MSETLKFGEGWAILYPRAAHCLFEIRTPEREQIDAIFASWRIERADATRRRMRKEIHRPTRLGVTHRHE